MKTWFASLLPAAAFLLLAVYGAGIFPWTVIVATVALCLGGWKSGVESRESRVESRESKVEIETEDGRLETEDGKTTPHAEETPPGHNGKSYRWAWRSPFVLLLLYLLVMLVPLPSSLPLPGGGERTRQNRLVVETLDAVAAVGVAHGVTPVFSLTRSRAGTLRFLLLAVLVFSGWRMAASSTARQREAALRAAVLVASVMALAGILGKWVIPQGDTLWWWIPIPHGRPGPMGGFMNRNHFAGFCAILVPAALVLTVRDAAQRRPLAALLNLSAAAMLAAGVLAALSRGGLVALAAGLAALLLIGLLRGRLRHRIALSCAVLLLAAAVLAVAWRQEAIRERFSSLRDPLATESVQDRMAAWRDALRIWRQYPLLGAGPNAFRVVYPQHRTTSARDARDFAENEYVQWLCETGLVGVLIALFLIGRLLHAALRALRDDSPGAQALTAAALAAMAAAAVHALADFPLHLPLYALTVAALAGMLGRQTADIGKKIPNPKSQIPNPSTLPALACLVIALALAVFDLQLDMDGRLGRAGFPATARGLAAAPTSPVAWRRLAALLWQTGTPAARTLAERCRTQATAYDPNNYELWRRLGDMRRELGDDRGAMDAYRRAKALRSWINVPTSLPEEN
jgi:hypothetical protein